MGFLGNLNKVNTLELFLTDKGKELMLKENGLGLQDLISRFSLDDSDYDYRRTSNVWIDGLSPSPDGSFSPFGTTQSLINNDGLGKVPNNDCRSCENGCFPLSGDCWFDMPDVRGNRSGKIVSCVFSAGTTITACTECQCLPAVFINKKGPIEVIDDGCPCIDGTISPKCCVTVGGGPTGTGGDTTGGGTTGGGTTNGNQIIQGICGPLPNFNTTNTVSQTVNQSGVLGRTNRQLSDDLYVPKSYTNFRSGLNEPDIGIGANTPPLDTTSKVNNYSSSYTTGFDINLQQYYVNGKLQWDVELVSTARYGNRLLTEGDGSEFYWFVSSGYKKSSRSPKETKACVTPTLSTINLNRNNNKGINVAYLKGYWNQKLEQDFISYKKTSDNSAISDPIASYEFCVTMVYTYEGKLLRTTRRFSVIGNNYGYKINVKS